MPDLPPAIGNCVTTTQFKEPSLAPLETAHQLTRSADGKIRVDTGNLSIISDPNTQKTILLNHLKQEAQVLSIAPPQAPGLQVPGMPQAAIPEMHGMSLPATPASIQDLGKKMIEGEEAEGRRITIQPPALPGMPTAPGMPAVPGMPGMPSIPGLSQRPGTPQLPPPPQVPSVTEIWTNPKLNLPVLTQVQGAFGTQICKCKNQAVPEPDPSLFQIPQNYKDITAPSVPGPSSLPGVPSAPAVPSVPGVPSALGVPSAPTVPSVPAVPSAPALPSVPGLPGFKR